MIVILSLPYGHPAHLSVFQKNTIDKVKERVINMELKKKIPLTCHLGKNCYFAAGQGCVRILSDQTLTIRARIQSRWL